LSLTWSKKKIQYYIRVNLTKIKLQMILGSDFYFFSLEKCTSLSVELCLKCLGIFICLFRRWDGISMNERFRMFKLFWYFGITNLYQSEWYIYKEATFGFILWKDGFSYILRYFSFLKGMYSFRLNWLDNVSNIYIFNLYYQNSLFEIYN
jgi:hypothetical protein